MLLSEFVHGHEFRDPSTYASFYYPPEGQDTEKEQTEAEQEAELCVKDDANVYQTELSKLFKDVKVTGEVDHIVDEDIESGKDYYHYTCKIKCKLLISIPKENFAGKADDEIFDEDFYSITAPTDIEYDEVDENVTDTNAEVTLSGIYTYYYENDKDYDF